MFRGSGSLNRSILKDWRTGPLVMVVSVITVMLTSIQGCGKTGDAQSGGANIEPDLGTIPVINRYAEVSFPLDGYRMSPEQRVTILNAADLAVRTCMKRFGLDYEIADRKVSPHVDRVIGVVEGSEVSEFGYKNRRMQLQANEAAKEKDHQRRNPRPPEMVSVLQGDGPTQYRGVEIPNGGCYGEAGRTLGSPEQANVSPGDDNFVLRLSSESGHLAEADSRLKKAFAVWSGCMSEAGYNYHDPWEANDDPKFATDTASQTEIVTAKADVACRIKHNVNGIWVAVQTAYQYRLIEQNAESLRQHRNLTGDRLRRATEIVSSAGK